MKFFNLLVYRQEKITPECHTLVKAETTEAIQTEKELLEAIRHAVKKWVLATHEGRAAYEYAGDDMNLGDVGDYADEIRKHAPNILSLSFESITPAEEWIYDTSLCDEIDDMPEELTEMVKTV